MISRRCFLRLAITGSLAIGGAALLRAQAVAPRIYLPIIQVPPSPDDAPLLGPASGTVDQAVAWFASRADSSYSDYDLGVIAGAYQTVGESVGMDWFLAMAQCVHETGSLTSWWSLRPRRNPAGLGVTGQVVAGTADAPPGPLTAWAWDESILSWRYGISFPTWTDQSVPAHLGRLLAYALTDEQADDTQRALIATALAYRPLPTNYRGAAPSIQGLNGRWAVPGTTYGQTIVDLMRRMLGTGGTSSPQSPLVL